MDRKSKTKERNATEITLAAQQLFAERGVQAVSMDDIALASGFSKGSLYNYFSNRDELVWTVISGLHKEFLERAEAIFQVPTPFRERFRAFLEMAFKLMEETVGLSEIMDFLISDSCCSHPTSSTIEFSRSFHTRLQPFFAAAHKRKELAVSDPVRLSITVTMATHHLYKAGQEGIITKERKDNIRFLMDLFLPKSTAHD